MDFNYALDNHPAVQDWTRETFKTRKGFDRHMLLLKDNRAKFTKIFGKRHGTFKSEFLFSIWAIEFRGRTYHVLTAKGKGTCYEIMLKSGETFTATCKNKKLGDDMVAFLEFMIKKIGA